MKVYFIAFIIVLSSASTLLSGAEFFFDSKNHDFPDTKEGVVLTWDYTFTNTGDSPLIINDYKVTCTCTTLDFPKEPIAPGGKGRVKLTFDTKGKFGFQSRKMEVLSNAKKSVKLGFRVFVIRAD